MNINYGNDMVYEVVDNHIFKVSVVHQPVWRLGTVQNIAVNDLEEEYTTYSYKTVPLEYIYLAMDSNNEELVDLSRAIYIYYQAGADYLKANLGGEFDTEIL